MDAAFIYGSWAGRYAGERGEAPGDIDLLILGRPDRRKLARLCRETTEELGFEVNPTVISGGDWEADATGFIRSIKEQPVVPLLGADDQADVQRLLAEKKIRAVSPDAETATSEIDVARRHIASAEKITDAKALAHRNVVSPPQRAHDAQGG